MGKSLAGRPRRPGEGQDGEFLHGPRANHQIVAAMSWAGAFRDRKVRLGADSDYHSLTFAVITLC